VSVVEEKVYLSRERNFLDPHLCSYPCNTSNSKPRHIPCKFIPGRNCRSVLGKTVTSEHLCLQIQKPIQN